MAANFLQLEDSAIIYPAIQNVIATFKLPIDLDLPELVQNCKNCEYNPRKFSAITLRIRKPKTTALIFSTGKIIIAGAKSENHAKQAARKFARIIQKAGADIKWSQGKFKIENIVASTDVGFSIRLESVAREYEAETSYDTELFPGLIYRFTEPKSLVALVFATGKVVFTGGRTTEDIREAFDMLYPLLRKSKYDTDGLDI